MGRLIIVLAALVAVALGAVYFLIQPHDGGQTANTNAAYDWEFNADNALIVGGYGNNFAYDGTNVRHIPGSATVKLTTATGEGVIEASVTTDDESGPIVMADGMPLSGNIKLVMKLGQGGTRFQEFKDLHGDTGNEAPVMPKLFNYWAGWGPTDVYVDGKLVYENLGGHVMYSEKARRANGTISRDDGTIYSPMLEDKTGFTDPNATEFHFVAHTMEPDPNNFPPHSMWIHLVFQDVKLQKAPKSIP